MISIFEGPTDGQIVYLFDPESARGNAQFAFKTLRFQNPTDSALESGPFSVFGEGRFIGEGLAEPIPAKSTAFVPFALDRQIVVEHKDEDHDEIARILTVSRGVFSTEVQHTRKQAFTLFNRGTERAVVYLRHTVPQGYKLTHAPNAIDAERREGNGAPRFSAPLPRRGGAARQDRSVDRRSDSRFPDDGYSNRRGPRARAGLCVARGTSATAS